MKTATKSQLLNALVIVIGTVTLLFSLGASWVIMHESVLLMHTMPIGTNTIIGGSIGMGLFLLWLNSLLVDSVIWTVNKYWKKGIKNG
tara:strand:- start:486 stop:749 length:264 start_codon:yes stop_codon:yes gene_type:complete